MAQEASKDPEQNASWGDCGLGGGAQGVESQDEELDLSGELSREEGGLGRGGLRERTEGTARGPCVGGDGSLEPRRGGAEICGDSTGSRRPLAAQWQTQPSLQSGPRSGLAWRMEDVRATPGPHPRLSRPALLHQTPFWDHTLVLPGLPLRLASSLLRRLSFARIHPGLHRLLQRSLMRQLRFRLRLPLPARLALLARGVSLLKNYVA
uniref:Uncharacterized protein n=1 Tax=Rangifer tarandus platyrhynchus TaxID=3082113 RepID=A0ACB0FG63_RANTA|nr:unnamed protein product [Rangifer tarandus platyrhynchus]